MTSKGCINIIITRSGGLDGVALQCDIYIKILKSLGYEVNVLTGKNEHLNKNDETTIPELYLYHPEVYSLYCGEFTHLSQSPNTEMEEQVWCASFLTLKQTLKEKIGLHLREGPVLIFNMVALRHMHPAAALALKEIMQEQTHRPFISHAADLDDERPEKISNLKPFVLKHISSSDERYSGGPYIFSNLFHIVLNSKQVNAFLNHYHVQHDHFFEIPDISYLDSDKLYSRMRDPEFLDYMSHKKVISHEESYTYQSTSCTDKTIFFVSPVRPVPRKRLRSALLAAHYYKMRRGLDVKFVLTHPKRDDPAYFNELVRFAQHIGIDFLYLGDDITSEQQLVDFYKNIAAHSCVGIVASSQGGFENALLEMASMGIPFVMSSILNSYDMLLIMDFHVCGLSFKELDKHIAQDADKLPEKVLVPELEMMVQWVDGVVGDSRAAVVANNFARLYENLSQHAASKKIENMFNRINLILK